jgi:hypothetical protein
MELKQLDVYLGQLLRKDMVSKSVHHSAPSGDAQSGSVDVFMACAGYPRPVESDFAEDFEPYFELTPG